MRKWSIVVTNNIVYVLLEDSFYDQRNSSEDEVEEGHVGVIKDSLPRIRGEEGKVELRDGEHHVFVEEVEDHLADSEVVPPSMDQKQPPQALELRKSVITRTYRSQSLFSIQSYADMSRCDHWHIVRSIAYCQGNFVEMVFNQFHDFCLLQRKESATNHCFTVLSHVRDDHFTLLVLEQNSKVLSFYQKCLFHS